jgi:hypothetical protein
VRRGPTPEALARGLRPATWLFLALPAAIFALGWLRPIAGVPLCALLAAGVARALRAPARAGAPESPLARGGIALGLLPIAGVTALCGAGGVGARVWDWHKHDAILLDLVRQPWPVAWRIGDETPAMVFYVAYYLPAAVLGKLGGLALADAALFATTLAGALLAALWAMALVRRAPALVGLCFALFGGLDALAWTAEWGFAKASSRLLWGMHIEAWSGLFAYFGHANALLWAPQHHLAAWLGAALAVDAARAREAALPALLLLALVALWSPFVAIGLAPLCGVALLAPRGAARAQCSLPNAAGAVLALVLALYYAARALPLALPDAYTDGMQMRPNGFLPLALGLDALEFAGLYAWFCALEFAVLALLVAIALRARRAASGDVHLLAALVATLQLLPLFRFGFYNDLSMRASSPALFALMVLAAGALLAREQPKALRVALAAVLAVGALGQASELRYAARAIADRGAWASSRALAAAPDLFELHLELLRTARGFDFAMQYLGSPRAPFFRWLAPPGAPREVRAHEVAPPASDERGAQAPQIGEEAQRLAQQPPRREPALPATAGAERDRRPAHPEPPHQQQRERHVLQLEAGGHVRQAGGERVATHQPVGHVGVAHRDAGGREGDGAQPARDQHPARPVAALDALAQHCVGALARGPERGEVARVALAVGVELEDPVRAARERGAVAGRAGRAVAGVGLVEHAELRQLAGQRVEDGRRGVARAVVDREQREARPGRAQRRDPLARHAGHGGGLVVHGHDGEELGVHGGARQRAARG